MEPTMFVLLPSVLVLLYVAETQSVTVDFIPNPKSGVIAGPESNVFLKCQWIGSFNNETDDLRIVKDNEGGGATILASKRGLHVDSEHMLFLKWYEEIHSLWILLQPVSRTDYGTYTCYAVRKESSDIFNQLGETTILLNITYPPSGDPLCSVSPNTTVFHDGDEVSLQCTSDAGNPPASLQWQQSNGTSLPKTSIIEKPRKVLEGTVSFVIDVSHNGVEFTCLRTNNDLSAISVSSCSLGPFTVLNKTLVSSMSLEDPIVIAGITIIPIIILTVTICTALFLVKSGRCRSSSNGGGNEVDAKMKPEIKLDGVQLSGDPSNNNPKPAPRILAPNGATCAAVQKDKPPKKIAAPKGKSYPKPPSYPRPPKVDDDEEGAQYANSHQLNGINEDAQYANPQHVNGVSNGTQYAKTKASIKTSNTKNNTENTVYSNTLDVTNNATDAEKVGDSCMYANTSGNPRVAAPNKTPPPPPSGGLDKGDPGVEYADLDMIKQSTNRNTLSNSQPVMYASVK